MKKTIILLLCLALSGNAHAFSVYDLSDLEQRSRIDVPIGTIVAITQPLINMHVYLECNGQKFDRDAYPTLFALLGTDYTPNFYAAQQESRPPVSSSENSDGEMQMRYTGSGSGGGKAGSPVKTSASGESSEICGSEEVEYDCECQSGHTETFVCGTEEQCAESDRIVECQCTYAVATENGVMFEDRFSAIGCGKNVHGSRCCGALVNCSRWNCMYVKDLNSGQKYCKEVPKYCQRTHPGSCRKCKRQVMNCLHIVEDNKAAGGGKRSNGGGGGSGGAGGRQMTDTVQNERQAVQQVQEMGPAKRFFIRALK